MVIKKINKLTEILEIIDTIEELPGDIPDEVYDLVRNGTKEEVAKILRSLVKITKGQIKHGITEIIMKGE